MSAIQAVSGTSHATQKTQVTGNFSNVVSLVVKAQRGQIATAAGTAFTQTPAKTNLIEAADNTKKPPTLEQKVRQVLNNIKAEARRQALTPIPTPEGASSLSTAITNRYFREYLADPSAEKGEEALDRIMGAQPDPEGAPQDAWTRWAAHNETKRLPELPVWAKALPLLKNVKDLPREIKNARGMMSQESRKDLPYIDLPYLLGLPNTAAEHDQSDVEIGGKNTTQVMHWANGAVYSQVCQDGARELNLAYEYYAPEGWAVFGEDAINDLISVEAGRIFGVEVRKGKDGKIEDEASLRQVMHDAFIDARAWVGKLVAAREKDLDAWITDREVAGNWAWRGQHSVTIKLENGQTVAEVMESSLVKAQIAIYRLMYEGKARNEMPLSALQKELLKDSSLIREYIG